MDVIAITGSASGVRAATRARLEASGAKVIGVDVRDAEIITDLAMGAGRFTAIEAIQRMAANRLKGLVVCAGVGPQAEPYSTTVSSTTSAARCCSKACAMRSPAARHRPPSRFRRTPPVPPGVETPLVTACLDGDEDERGVSP